MPTLNDSPSEDGDFEPNLIFQDVPPTCFASSSIPLDLMEQFKRYGGKTSVDSVFKAQSSSSTHASLSDTLYDPTRTPFSLYLVIPTDLEGIRRLLSARPLVLYDVKWVSDSIEEGEALDLGPYVIDPIATFTSSKGISGAVGPQKPDHDQQSNLGTITEEEAPQPEEEAEEDIDSASCSRQKNVQGVVADTGSPNVKRERSESIEDEEAHPEQNEEQDEDPDHAIRTKRDRVVRECSVEDDSKTAFPHRSPPSSPVSAAHSHRRSHSVYPSWRTRQFIPRPEVQSMYKREPTPLVTTHPNCISNPAAPRPMIVPDEPPDIDSKRFPKKTKVDHPVNNPNGPQEYPGSPSGPSQPAINTENHYTPPARGSRHGDQAISEADEEDDRTIATDHINTPSIKTEPMDDDKDEVVSLAPTWKDDDSEFSEEEVEPVEFKPFDMMKYQSMGDSSKPTR